MAKGRSGLVMSPSKRERVMRKEKELRDFLAEHPWFGQIEGWQREVIRRMLYGLQHTGRQREARRLRQMLFTVGDCLGKEVIWPILEHLLEGGVFDFDGKQICGDLPNTKNLPPVNLEEFLAAHVPADRRSTPLLLTRLMLKAQAGADELVRLTLENRKEYATECASGQVLQIPPADEAAG